MLDLVFRRPNATSECKITAPADLIRGNECCAVSHGTPELTDACYQIPPSPGNNIIITIIAPFDLQHRGRPPTPATHHYLFAFALNRHPSSASAIQPPTSLREGSGPRGQPTIDTTPRAARSIFRHSAGKLLLSTLLPSDNFAIIIFYCYIVLWRRYRLATLNTRLISQRPRSTLYPQPGHHSARSSTLEPSSLQDTPCHHH